LRSERFRIAIDDFGKGYSNLSRLAILSVDTIKIDRSISSGAALDNKVRQIMASTIAMAHSIGCEVVVEGIETVEMRQMAIDDGADYLQGFLFARSMPFGKWLTWLDENSNAAAEQPQENAAVAA